MKVTQHQGTSLDYIALEPDNYDPYSSYPLIVLLHGFGSHMGDLARLCPIIQSNAYRYILPNAPIPIPIGYGAIGYAWFSLPNDKNTISITEEVRAAETKISALVHEVAKRYEVEFGNIVLGGFSQGGMLTLQSGLTRPEVFRGLAVLSGKLLETNVLNRRLPDQRCQSIFVAHGKDDDVIVVEEGRQVVKLLDFNGYKPEYHEYDMGHEITTDVLDDLSDWLKTILPSPRKRDYQS